MLEKIKLVKFVAVVFSFQSQFTVGSGGQQLAVAVSSRGQQSRSAVTVSSY